MSDATSIQSVPTTINEISTGGGNYYGGGGPYRGHAPGHFGHYAHYDGHHGHHGHHGHRYGYYDYCAVPPPRWTGLPAACTSGVIPAVVANNRRRDHHDFRDFGRGLRGGFHDYRDYHDRRDYKYGKRY